MNSTDLSVPTKRTSLAALVVLSVLLSTPAFAGLGSLLGKLGKFGGKTGKVVAKTAPLTRVTRVGRGVALASGAVAAERASLAFAHLGDDAARSAGYLARTADGELVLVTRAGQSTPGVEGLRPAVDALAAPGGSATVLVDASAATDDALRALPDDAKLVLVHDGVQSPMRREGAGKFAEFIVDTAEGAVDLKDLVADGADDEDDGGSGTTIFVVFIVVLVLGGVVLRMRG